MDIAPLQTGSQTPAPAPVSAYAEQQAQNRELIQAVHAINAAELFGEDSELTFALDRKTGRGVIRLVRRKTREWIREISSEDVLNLANARQDEHG
jgi:uncharacterized FlaG/YvyC family protein